MKVRINMGKKERQDEEIEKKLFFKHKMNDKNFTIFKNYCRFDYYFLKLFFF